MVTLLVKFRNKDCKTTELGLLLQVLPVRIVTFVETLGSHLKRHHYQKPIAGKCDCYIIITRGHLAAKHYCHVIITRVHLAGKPYCYVIITREHLAR